MPQTLSIIIVFSNFVKIIIIIIILFMGLRTSCAFYLRTSNSDILVLMLRLSKWVSGGEVNCCGHETYHLQGQNST